MLSLIACAWFEHRGLVFPLNIMRDEMINEWVVNVKDNNSIIVNLYRKIANNSSRLLSEENSVLN